MNTTLTPEAPASLKTTARQARKSKVQPVTNEPPLMPEPEWTPEVIAAIFNQVEPDNVSSLPLLEAEIKERLNLIEELEEPVNLTPETIVEIARQEGTLFFRDQHGVAFAWIRKTDEDQSHFECIHVRAAVFRARLLELIHVKTKISPKPKDLKKAIEILELLAFRTAPRNLDNRHKVVDDAIYIDLGDREWRMVTVTRDGWQVRSQDQPRFFRPQHILPLPVPVTGGDVMDLYKFIPVESADEKLLVMTWLLAGMYPAIPIPIINLVGQQGSAKTTRSRRLRSLLDPSLTPVLGDTEMSGLFLTFQHHAVPCFENVSQFKRREADMFCRAVTGNGIERRKLYTDSDAVLYSFRRPIILNGIDIPSTRPDFLDRCLIINCQRIQTFTPLEVLDQQFESARPKLFGAMLDLLTKTLKILDSTPGDSEFRMADFARFGRAVAIALGQQAKDFDDAYRLNIRHRDFEVLEDAPMTRVLKAFASEYPESNPWVGTSEALLDALCKVANDKKDLAAKKNLPSSARWLSSRLGEMASALATVGIVVTKLPRTNAKRAWRVFAKIPATDGTSDQ